MKHSEDVHKPWKKRRINDSESAIDSGNRSQDSLGSSNEIMLENTTTDSCMQSVLNKDVPNNIGRNDDFNRSLKSFPSTSNKLDTTHEAHEQTESYTSDTNETVDSNDSDNQIHTKETNGGITPSKWSSGKKHGASRHISKQMIQQVMHLKQKAAANELKIGVSTLKKRFGKLFHNDRWPSTDAERMKMASYIDQQAKEKGSLRYLIHNYDQNECYFDQAAISYLQQQKSRKDRRYRSRNSSHTSSSKHGGFSLIETRFVGAKPKLSHQSEEDLASDTTLDEQDSNEEISPIKQHTPSELSTIMNMLPSVWGSIPTHSVKHFCEKLECDEPQKESTSAI